MTTLALQTRAQTTEPTDLDHLYLPCWANGNGSGTITRLEMVSRATGEVFSLPIVSKHPLQHSEIKSAIAKATGKTHWDFKWQAISCSDYEF
jgi:hypothetical protein